MPRLDLTQRTLTRNPTFSPSLVSTPLSFRFISCHFLTGASSLPLGPMVTLRVPMVSHYYLDIQKFLDLPVSDTFQNISGEEVTGLA